jgi:hypothetical protein
MNATEVGFNGEADMWIDNPWYSGFINSPMKIKFTRGKTEHFNRAEEKPNQFFWNTETEQFYYINKDKKRFRVEFVEENN